MSNLEEILEKNRRIHVFRVFRFPLRFMIGPVFVSFALVDFLYVREFWIEGFALRTAWWALVHLGFYLLTFKKIRNKYRNLIPAVILVLSGWIVDWMIWRSGGYESFYITGLILVNVTGLQVIGFPRKYATSISIISYLPAIVVVWLTAGIAEATLALIQSAFLIGMILLSWIYKSTEDQQKKGWALRQSKIAEEVAKLRRTEYLSRHFPITLLKQIESGELNLPPKKLHPNAVVGFADISSSTAISNEVDLLTDWTLKENFLESAVKRATENGLIVLSQQGDGCFFLANHSGDETWPVNVISFFENLLLDFKNISSNSNLPLKQFETGIKFGVAMGPAMVGFIGRDQPYYTANGPDVNLASRLCSEASKNELVVSSRVWHTLRNYLNGWDAREEIHNSIKGFSNPIPAVRIRPRLAADGDGPVCKLCGAPLMVISTPEGMLDIKCANGHVGTETQNRIKAS